MRIRIGTRGSLLARTQSTTIAASLEESGHETELVIIKTAGDQSTATSFGAIGPQGVFVREIEQALLDGHVDIAVHSYKDLPTASPAGLVIAAVPPRRDAADVLAVRKEVATGNDRGLPIAPGTRVGTASARRQAWIRHLRPDLVVAPTRGNVPTRLGRLREGFDGVVLAAAGLERLGASPLEGAREIDLTDIVIERLDPEVFVPAPAQGALAVQCRRSDTELCAAVRILDDPSTRRCIHAERTLLERVEGGCDVAFGAYAGPDAGAEDTFRLTARLERGGRILTGKARGPDVLALVESAWQALERGRP